MLALVHQAQFFRVMLLGFPSRLDGLFYCLYLLWLKFWNSIGSNINHIILEYFWQVSFIILFGAVLQEFGIFSTKLFLELFEIIYHFKNAKSVH